MLNESKKFIHKLNKFSFRRFTTTKKSDDLIRVKSLSRLSEFDARKLFNINKDVLVLKVKVPETFTLYRASPRISLFFIFLGLGFCTVFLGYVKGNSNKKTLLKPFNIAVIALGLGTIFVLYSFIFRLVKRIDVLSMKDNKLRVYLLHKTIDTDFDKIRYMKKGLNLFVKDDKYYLADRKAKIFNNQELVFAILKGYKIKTI